jgi:hypothetical protein
LPAAVHLHAAPPSSPPHASSWWEDSLRASVWSLLALLRSAVALVNGTAAQLRPREPRAGIHQGPVWQPPAKLAEVIAS